MTPKWEQRFLIWTGGTSLILLALGWCLRHGPESLREVSAMVKGWDWKGPLA